MSTIYLKHSIDGRLRFKLASVKSSRAIAQEIENLLDNHEAINKCKANHVTGSVIINYDSDVADETTVLQLLKDSGYFKGDPQIDNLKNEPQDSENSIGKIIFTKAVEIAAERAILALL